MRRAASTGPTAVGRSRQRRFADRASALVDAARRGLWLYTPRPRPGLLDRAAVIEAFAASPLPAAATKLRVLLQDAAAPQRGHAPLLALAQRLPSVFLFREVDDPVDRAYPSAYLANDAGGYSSAPWATASTARPTCTRRAARGSCAGRSWRSGNGRAR